MTTPAPPSGGIDSFLQHKYLGIPGWGWAVGAAGGVDAAERSARERVALSATGGLTPSTETLLSSSSAGTHRGGSA